eukprot:CCRYP_000373-RA/>CCRYP_000373-RA protein AED:0.36 eAED:0.36 QI:0/0/0/1/0/0/3/0/200
MSTTMITGSTAAGEPILPHFQFSTMAQSEDTQCVNIRMSAFFPKIKHVRGKRVIMKVNSGPGRMELGFLAEARTLGFIIYHGVPNTTAVTQKTNQSYGTFKTQFVKNLKILSDARIEKIQKATTQGNLFHATGGGQITDDDNFLAAQKKVVETEIKELQKRKDSAGKMHDIERKARQILVQTNSFQTYNIEVLRVLLTYY